MLYVKKVPFKYRRNVLKDSVIRFLKFSLVVFVKTVKEKRVRISLIKEDCKNHLSCPNN
jgi:hypothetical protein